MDVTKMLEADHREVEDLFARIEASEGAERQPMIDELATSLRAHMALEEAVVYPAMKPVVGDEAVEEGNVEHQLGRKVLEDVLRLAPAEPGFGAALDALKAGIQHHVDEEEDEVFPTLRRQGKDVLAAMATPFMQKRVELGMPVDADALAASSTKDELLAEAQSADVEGASSMTKAELAEALTAKMS
jgi:iron-sulfur cluster repair protein YtfE (RIC family)